MKEVVRLAQEYLLLSKGAGNFNHCVDWALEKLEKDAHNLDIVMLAAAASQDEAIPYVESILKAHFGIPLVNEDILSNSCGVTPLECSFFFEVLAPNGLDGLEEPLSRSSLGLYVYHSNFNDKNILKSSGNLLELGMDTSTTDAMHGSGILYCDFETAISSMQRLSDIFTKAGYRHKIGIDDENGSNTVWISGPSP